MIKSTIAYTTQQLQCHNNIIQIWCFVSVQDKNKDMVKNILTWFMSGTILQQ